MMKKLLAILAAVLCMMLGAAGADPSGNLPDEAELVSKTMEILDYLDLHGKDDYDIIFGVYNYVCQTVVYDWAAIDNFPWDGETLGCGQTAYEALCEEKAVCAGIARAVTLLLDEMDVPCKTVVGYDETGLGHAWNMVELNGLWYFMDATKDLGNTTYSRFLKSWDDLGDYAVFSDGDFNIADYTLASVSYTDEMASAMDSYGGFHFNAGLGDITIHSYTGEEANVVVPAEINGRKVKHLSQYCFLQNSSIETLVISEGIESISSLFAGSCSNLKAISIPSTAKLVSGSSGAFVTGLDGFVDHCFAVETVTVAQGNPYLCVVDNVLYDKERTNILHYPAQKKTEVFHVPEGVQTIRSDAFACNEYVKEIVLPDSVTSIGYWAFNQCTSLEKVNIPKDCVSIGQYAFQGTQLAQVHIPAATQIIVCPAFSATLSQITVDAGNPYFYAVDNVLFSNSGALLAYAARKSDTTYTVPAGVKKIELHAFHGASNLKEVVLPDGLSSVEYGAFYACVGLTEITLPETVEYLGGSAFFDCFSLKKVVIPASVKTIDNDHVLANVIGTVIWGEAGSAAQVWAERNGFAFQDINSSWNVSGTCGDNISWTLSEDGVLSITGTGEMGECNPAPWEKYVAMVHTAIVGDGITALADHAFFNHYGLSTVVLPQSLTEVGEYAFAGCTSLESIELPDDVKYIRHYTFWNCTALKHIELPDNLLEILGSAFWSCTSLESIDLPERMISIGNGTFNNCTSLKKVELPKELLFIWESAFEGCTSLMSIELPENLMQVAEKAFVNCTSLLSIIIRSRTMPAVLDGAFDGCNPSVYCHIGSEGEAWAAERGYKVMPIDILNGVLPDDYEEYMTVLQLPAQLISVEAEAFVNLPVQVVIVPEGCESIGSRAFAGCTELVYVRIPAAAEVADDAFEGCSNVYIDTAE